MSKVTVETKKQVIFADVLIRQKKRFLAGLRFVNLNFPPYLTTKSEFQRRTTTIKNLKIWYSTEI